MIEVVIHIQKALADLAEVGDTVCTECARNYAQLSYKRASKSLTLEEDIERLSKFIRK